MTARIQVLLEENEKEAFQRHARQEGLSLSAWLREAGKERLMSRGGQPRIDTREDLRAFFAASDAREEGCEPEWEEHLATMEHSKTGRAAKT